MKNKKRRRRKPTAQFSRQLETLLLNILSGLITAALAKMFHLD